MVRLLTKLVKSQGCVAQCVYYILLLPAVGLSVSCALRKMAFYLPALKFKDLFKKWGIAAPQSC